MYVYLKSTDSIDIHQANSTYVFTVELPTSLTFDGNWYCALLYCSQPKREDHVILCDILEDSIIHGTLRPVLRKVKAKVEEFDLLHYVRVNAQSTSRLALRVLKADTLLPPNPAPPNSVVSMCLHFKKL